MKAGDGLSAARAPTGGDSSAFISTSAEFVNGGNDGLMPPAGDDEGDAKRQCNHHSAKYRNAAGQRYYIGQQCAIFNLQNDLNTANGNINKSWTRLLFRASEYP